MMSAMDDPSSPATLQFGPVTLVPDERVVLKDGKPVPLTPKALDLLVVLARTPGRLLTKEFLLQAVWPDTAVEESNLAYHVFAIRKALGDTTDGERDAEKYIETVPRRGYRFIAPVVRGADGLPDALPRAEPLEVPAISSAAPAAEGADHRSRRWRSGVMLGVGLALGALVVLGQRQLRPRPTSSQPPALHFLEPVTGHLAESGMFAVSPDGRRLVFAAEGLDGVMRLWLRSFSALQPVPLAGTEVFTIVPPMVWSPDSRFIAYDATSVLKKVSVDGGAPQTVCELPGTAVGGSWNAAGDIIVGNAFGGLIRCPAAGGTPAIITEPNRATQDVHIMPSFLPDGRHFVYLSVSRSNPELTGVFAGELGGRSPVGDRLIATGFGVAFVPATDAGPGAVVFVRDGALFAQRFDEQQLTVTGEPMRLATDIGSYLDTAFFSVSSLALVFRSPESAFQLTWFDRQGHELGRVGTPARFSDLALSPAGGRILVATHAPVGTANQDLWLFDLLQSAAPRRMTFEPVIERDPVWLTDDRFAFGTAGGPSGVYQQPVNGQPELFFKSGRPEVLSSMSVDGAIALYTTPHVGATRADVWVRAVNGTSATVNPFLNREHDETQAQLSPDRRWVAYVSNESGPNEIFVTEFRFDPASATARPGDSIRLSEGGGMAPRWRRDGRELFYLAPDGAVMSIAVDGRGMFHGRPATTLFKVPGAIPGWGITADGERFLFAVPVSPPPPFNVIQGWQGLLK
jgi:eukaryotic-like serine/threonine-protein kinase